MRESAASVMKGSKRSTKEEERSLLEAHMNYESRHEVYRSTIKKFEDTFDEQLAEFLKRLWEDSSRSHPQLSNLCARLDYNGFYTEKFTDPLQNF